MPDIKELLEKNHEWAERINREDPNFFPTLAAQQAPEYLWIGCSDSRVPANDIVGLLPGELFVHRNVANLVVATDMNCMSVIQFAVDVLKVKHIIVTGHYGCGGVRAAIEGNKLGLIDNWLTHIRDTYRRHERELRKLDDEVEVDRLCELNVIEQVFNVCHTTIVQDAWARGQSLSVHGWIYGLKNGKVKDLGVCVSSPEEVSSVYRWKIDPDPS